MTKRPRGFRDSMLADRLVRVFGGGGALILTALSVTSVVQLGFELFNGGVVWPLIIVALISAGLAIPLARLHRNHARRSQP